REWRAGGIAGARLVCREPVDFVHVLARQAPGSGPDIGLDLSGARRAGDDAGDPRPVQQPAQSQFQQIVAARLAEIGQPLDDGPVPFSQPALGGTRRGRQPGVGGHRRIAAVFAGQQSIRQRRKRDQPEPVALDHRHQVAIEIAVDEAVALLARDVALEAEMARTPLRLDDLPGRQGRAADIAHLALLHEVVEGAQGLFDRRLGVGDMLLVEVDIIGVEPLQARLDGRHDVAPGGALPSPFPVHRPGKFAGEHDLVPPSGEGTAQLFLRPAALAIGVGGVEKGDAEIESLVHDGARRRIIDAPAEIVAAEPNRRDDQPGTTEIALLHRGMPYPVTIGRHYRQKKGPCMQQIAAAAALPGAETMWVVTILFVLTYVLIVTDRINRSIIALLGAGVMVVSGVLSQEEAIRGIDFNTIALLTGMMVLVAIARRCGMFEALAVWAAQKGRAEPWAILAMLSLVTAVVSAFLDNVTTVLLIAPVTLEIARYLEAPPYPFLFAEVFASNIGGTATLIGDPPNIIIGSAAHLSFNDFVVNLTPVLIVVMAVQLVATHLIWGRKMQAGAAARERIMALDAKELITDPPLMRSSLLVIGGVIAA